MAIQRPTLNENFSAAININSDGVSVDNSVFMLSDDFEPVCFVKFSSCVFLLKSLLEIVVTVLGFQNNTPYFFC